MKIDLRKSVDDFDFTSRIVKGLPIFCYEAGAYLLTKSTNEQYWDP